jgi:hypothetical protein
MYCSLIYSWNSTQQTNRELKEAYRGNPNKKFSEKRYSRRYIRETEEEGGTSKRNKKIRMGRSKKGNGLSSF